MKPVITTYSSSDQKAVKELILTELKRSGFNYDRKYDSDLDDPDKAYIQNGGMFYVLKNGENIIGTVAVINHVRLAELKRLYVSSDFQGLGFGSMLLEKAVEFCKDNHFCALILETNKKFKKAHQLYRKYNFKVVKEDSESYYLEKRI